MEKYPPLEEQPPNPYDDNDYRRWEEALRQLAVADHLIKRCEKCNIPTAASRADCDALCRFFNSLIAEFKGPQSPIGA